MHVYGDVSISSRPAQKWALLKGRILYGNDKAAPKIFSICLLKRRSRIEMSAETNTFSITDKTKHETATFVVSFENSGLFESFIASMTHPMTWNQKRQAPRMQNTRETDQLYQYKSQRRRK